MRFTPTGVGTMAARLTARLGASGSPPRAWGQFRIHPQHRYLIRFTPTGVGTMPRTPVCIDAAMVHPHGRGDNIRIGAGQVAARGSPPRAWGQ